jgi:hypothetical protein
MEHTKSDSKPLNPVTSISKKELPSETFKVTKIRANYAQSSIPIPAIQREFYKRTLYQCGDNTLEPEDFRVHAKDFPLRVLKRKASAYKRMNPNYSTFDLDDPEEYIAKIRAVVDARSLCRKDQIDPSVLKPIDYGQGMITEKNLTVVGGLKTFRPLITNFRVNPDTHSFMTRCDPTMNVAFDPESYTNVLEREILSDTLILEEDETLDFLHEYKGKYYHTSTGTQIPKDFRRVDVSFGDNEKFFRTMTDLFERSPYDFTRVMASMILRQYQRIIDCLAQEKGLIVNLSKFRFQHMTRFNYHKFSLIDCDSFIKNGVKFLFIFDKPLYDCLLETKSRNLGYTLDYGKSLRFDPICGDKLKTDKGNGSSILRGSGVILAEPILFISVECLVTNGFIHGIFGQQFHLKDFVRMVMRQQESKTVGYKVRDFKSVVFYMGHVMVHLPLEYREKMLILKDFTMTFGPNKNHDQIIVYFDLMSLIQFPDENPEENPKHAWRTNLGLAATNELINMQNLATNYDQTVKAVEVVASKREIEEKTMDWVPKFSKSESVILFFTDEMQAKKGELDRVLTEKIGGQIKGIDTSNFQKYSKGVKNLLDYVQDQTFVKERSNLEGNSAMLDLSQFKDAKEYRNLRLAPDGQDENTWGWTKDPVNPNSPDFECDPDLGPGEEEYDSSSEEDVAPGASSRNLGDWHGLV